MSNRSGVLKVKQLTADHTTTSHDELQRLAALNLPTSKIQGLSQLFNLRGMNKKVKREREVYAWQEKPYTLNHTKAFTEPSLWQVLKIDMLA